ncbi:hypothetical protein GCM10027290_07910 [Micromonospora sonneratiae]|uniref:Response regulatory domain-containing protein n=1 Tax=Micromonospora sonneratiae TaxID=1184706 RepID=A0ABW3YEC6_9ACTN
MSGRVQRLVAVLYEHPLLGEGLARILLVETDAEVAVAPAGNGRVVEAVLARQPDVVIFEGSRCEPDCRRLAPKAVLIDVTSAMSTATYAPTANADLGRIILAARGGDAAPQVAGAGRPALPGR